MKYKILSLCFLAIVFVHSEKVLSQIEKPLVLQYQVSHSRNIDQISLIFKEKLYLVVNTSSFQKLQPVRLGIFTLDMNKNLFQLKEEFENTL